jgi:hypothetical protein
MITYTFSFTEAGFGGHDSALKQMDHVSAQSDATQVLATAGLIRISKKCDSSWHPRTHESYAEGLLVYLICRYHCER